jgi:hypothetical protein
MIKVLTWVLGYIILCINISYSQEGFTFAEFYGFNSGEDFSSLVNDGSFEDDIVWDDLNLEGGETKEISTTRSWHGGKSLHLVMDGSNEGADQPNADAMTIVTGSVYQISCWIYVVSGTFRVFDTNNRINFTFNTDAGDVGKWVKFSTTATGAAGSEVVQFVCTAGGGGEAYLDNLFIQIIEH